MARRPNYRMQRMDRERAQQQKAQEKLKERQAASEQRKQTRGEGEDDGTDAAPEPGNKQE